MIMHSLIGVVGSIGSSAVCERLIFLNYIKLMAFKLQTEILILSVCC